MNRQHAKKIAILISGRGSNMVALIDAASDPAFPAEIVGVISDKADAAGLRLAAARGIPTRAVVKKASDTKQAHDAAIGAVLAEFGAEIVCLAGYMRLLTAEFVEKWQGRMLNIHPALLPSFKGLNTHEQALEAGARIHGCTVHFVTSKMDDGPIVAQAAVPVVVGDTADSLSARVLRAEHSLYPIALRLVAEGEARMDGDKTVFSNIDESEKASKVILSSPNPLRAEINLEQLARVTP